jgi:hypothetical protein
LIRLASAFALAAITKTFVCSSAVLLVSFAIDLAIEAARQAAVAAIAVKRAIATLVNVLRPKFIPPILANRSDPGQEAPQQFVAARHVTWF